MMMCATSFNNIEMKKKMTKSHNNRPLSYNKNLIYEACILCGKKTNVLMEEPVAERKNYVEGVGQLCESCYLRIMGRKENR